MERARDPHRGTGSPGASMGQRRAPPVSHTTGVPDPGRGLEPSLTRMSGTTAGIRITSGSPSGSGAPIQGEAHKMLGLLETNTADGNRHLTRRRAPRVAAVAVMAGLVLGAAACGSSGGSATPTTKATTTTVAINPATATADITTAYNTLFNLSNPSLPGKVAVIQDGSQVSPALQQALSSSEASAAQGSKIDSVEHPDRGPVRQAVAAGAVRPRGL